MGDLTGSESLTQEERERKAKSKPLCVMKDAKHAVNGRIRN